MEENQNNETKFKAIPVTESSSSSKSAKSTSGFGKSVLIPFISGVVGCAVVIGTCFGVPSIKSKLIGSTTSNISNSGNNSTQSNGYVKEIQQYMLQIKYYHLLLA